MNDELFEELVHDVVESAMRDWGRPVVLTTTRWSYDPATGEQVETTSIDLETVGILSGGATLPTGGTALGERTRERLLLVRASEFGEAATVGRGAVIDDVRYRVVGTKERGGRLIGLQLVEVAKVAVTGAGQSGAAA